MFDKYYQDELTYLRDLGREFAHEYPALARTLGQTSRDPDVERLLEGVAFLTGRVRQKLDDEVPEIIHAVASLLFPHLLRPVPAATILELVPNNSVRNRQIVPAEAEFSTKKGKADNPPCIFSSTTPCEVMPWKLDAIRLQAGRNDKPSLSFTLNLVAGVTLGQLAPERVRLHVTEETRIALMLTYFVVERYKSVSLTANTPGAKSAAVYTLERGARSSWVNSDTPPIRHVGFEDDEALLPLIGHVMPGFRLVEEYFMLPNKFAFFEIQGLQKIAAMAPKATSLEINIEFSSRPPLAHTLKSDCLRLHCVPAVNVFKTTARNITVDCGRDSYLLRPENLAPDQGSVYAILDVVGRERGSGKKIPVKPFFDFAHVADPDNSLTYVAHWQYGTIRDEIEQRLRLSWAELEQARHNRAEQRLSIDRPGSDRELDIDLVLSIALLATNGRLCSEIGIGEVCEKTPNSPTFAEFRNLSVPTPYVPVPLGNELHWRVIAHISTGLRTLADPKVLRAALQIYNLHGLVDRQSARAAELRIEAIRSVSLSRAERLSRGAIVRGIAIEVELDESSFEGEGDMYVFSAVLDRLFASYVPINSFAETTVTGQSSRVRTAFAAKYGGVEII